jgi:hypothetical protein
MHCIKTLFSSLLLCLTAWSYRIVPSDEIAQAIVCAKASGRGDACQQWFGGVKSLETELIMLYSQRWAPEHERIATEYNVEVPVLASLREHFSLLRGDDDSFGIGPF